MRLRNIRRTCYALHITTCPTELQISKAAPIRMARMRLLRVVERAPDMESGGVQKVESLRRADARARRSQRLEYGRGSVGHQATNRTASDSPIEGYAAERRSGARRPQMQLQQNEFAPL
jgi:hypothetical protein